MWLFLRNLCSQVSVSSVLNRQTRDRLETGVDLVTETRNFELRIHEGTTEQEIYDLIREKTQATESTIKTHKPLTVVDKMSFVLSTHFLRNSKTT